MKKSHNYLMVISLNILMIVLLYLFLKVLYTDIVASSKTSIEFSVFSIKYTNIYINTSLILLLIMAILNMFLFGKSLKLMRRIVVTGLIWVLSVAIVVTVFFSLSTQMHELFKQLSAN